MIDSQSLWIVILGLGLGSFGFRFAFTGIIGSRPMPAWVLRHLRYTAVAVLPALFAPAVVWPSATGGAPDPARLSAAAVTLVIGLWTKNVFAAMFAGGGTLFAMLYLLG